MFPGDEHATGNTAVNPVPALRRLAPLMALKAPDIWEDAKESINAAETAAERAKHAANFAYNASQIAVDAAIDASDLVKAARRKIDELHFMQVAQDICANVHDTEHKSKEQKNKTDDKPAKRGVKRKP